MLPRLARLLVVLLIFSSLALKEAQASAPQAAGTPSSKARYYPLARDYRLRILEKIEAPFLVSASLPPLQFAQLSPSSFRHEDERNGRWLSDDNPSDFLMSLQP